MQKAMLAMAGIVGAAVIGAAAYFAFVPRDDAPVSPAAINIAGADIGGPFRLVRHDGVEVSEADVITGPTLVYFGYTFCPDICPIDVQVMVEAVDILAERGIAVQPVFVTVDPARDTPEELTPFVEAMHPDMIGLTGSEAAIRAAADAYKVYYSKVTVEGSAADYLMNHTGYTYLMLPDGIAGLFRRDFPPADIADAIEAILAHKGVVG
jgi:protein SCO1/2